MQDFNGVADLLGPDDIWEKFGLDAKQTNLFDIPKRLGSDIISDDGSIDEESEDDGRELNPARILACTQRGAGIMATEPNLMNQSKMLRDIYRTCTLKRTFASEHGGEQVVQGMPSHKRVTIPLRIQDDLAHRLEAIMDKHKRGWFHYSNSKMVMGASKARQLCHCTIFMGFDGFVADAAECKDFQTTVKWTPIKKKPIKGTPMKKRGRPWSG